MIQALLLFRIFGCTIFQFRCNLRGIWQLQSGWLGSPLKQKLGAWKLAFFFGYCGRGFVCFLPTWAWSKTMGVWVNWFVFEVSNNKTTSRFFFLWFFCTGDIIKLGGGFKYSLFSSLFGEDFQFDYCFSKGLKPPTSKEHFVQQSSDLFAGPPTKSLTPQSCQ